MASPPPRSPALRAKSSLSSHLKSGPVPLATARLATQQVAQLALSSAMNASAMHPTAPFSPHARSQSRPQSHYQQKAPGKISGIPLPRYHPATYMSPANSSLTSPASTVVSPHDGPLSPRSHAHARGEAQRRLAVYQHEFVAFKHAGTPGLKPASPTLHPSMSPCPVTPLELEEEKDDYLLAGSGASGHLGDREKHELVSKMISVECTPATSTDSRAPK